MLGELRSLPIPASCRFCGRNPFLRTILGGGGPGVSPKIFLPAYSSNNMIDLMERITVMLRQESTTYSTRDYLEASYQRKLTSPEDPVCALGGASAASSSSSTINEVWREKICEWSFQVIDHFDFSREVVSVSIHYLDMYLSTRTVNKKIFQLAAMTCLFLAIKLHESGNISMASMIELSRGYFTVEQMEAMELSILRYVPTKG